MWTPFKACSLVYFNNMCNQPSNPCFGLFSALVMPSFLSIATLRICRMITYIHSSTPKKKNSESLAISFLGGNLIWKCRNLCLFPTVPLFVCFSSKMVSTNHDAQNCPVMLCMVLSIVLLQVSMQEGLVCSKMCCLLSIPNMDVLLIRQSSLIKIKNKK